MNKKKTRAGVIGRLFGLALEVPPAAYMVMTGNAPLWARVWLGAFLSLWLLMTIVMGTLATEKAGT